MSQLIVRQLLIDLETTVPVRWHQDAFVTAFMNALSMSFPVGEQFFIDSLRRGMKQLPPEVQVQYTKEVHGFIGQEATHRRIHQLFNQHLQAQGLVNHWSPRALKRIAKVEQLDVRHAVAATAATEHFTATLAHWLLSHPEMLDNVEPRLRTMWLWHASEESEHRNTAFNIYLSLGGNQAWRLHAMRFVSFFLLTDLLRQTVNNLWHEGSLFKISTWRGAWHFLFTKQGLLTSSFAMWRRYFDADFHPSQDDDSLSKHWLQTHQHAYTPVGHST